MRDIFDKLTEWHKIESEKSIEEIVTALQKIKRPFLPSPSMFSHPTTPFLLSHFHSKHPPPTFPSLPSFHPCRVTNFSSSHTPSADITTQLAPPTPPHEGPTPARSGPPAHNQRNDEVLPVHPQPRLPHESCPTPLHAATGTCRFVVRRLRSAFYI